MLPSYSRKIIGTDADDTLRGDTRNDWILGNGGADALVGLGGHDLLDGGAGADHYIDGGDGNDHLKGGAGDDNLYGGNGSDILDGGPGEDLLYGGPGNDVYMLRAGESAGSPSGDINEGLSQGLDTLRILGVRPLDVSLSVNSSSQLAIKGGNGSITAFHLPSLVSANGNDLGQRFERVAFDDGTIWNLTGPLRLTGTEASDDFTGSRFADRFEGRGSRDNIFGCDGDDVLSGGNGDDQIGGGDGNDVLLGGAGSDGLTGDAGSDRLVGGAGDDFYTVGAGDIIIEAAGGGVDTVYTSASRTLETYCNNLNLTGAIDGRGNQFANVIEGSENANRIDGGAGADRIIGGRGDDTLRGGLDADTFVFAPGLGYDAVSGLGHDVIKDFDIDGADHDILEVRGGFGAGATGNIGALLMKATDTIAGTVIAFGQEERLLLEDVTTAQMRGHPECFVFLID